MITVITLSEVITLPSLTHSSVFLGDKLLKLPQLCMLGSESAVFSKRVKNSLTPYIGTPVHDNCCRGDLGMPKNVKRGFFGHFFLGTNFKEVPGIYLPNISELLVQTGENPRQKGYLLDTR